MTTWEYRTERISARWGERPTSSDALNRLGAEGWEAVGFSYSFFGGTYTVLLKRPIT